MFYYIGWMFIFVLVLLLVNLLSKHLREIVLCLAKIIVSVGVTLLLMVMVYVFENADKMAGIVQGLNARLSEFRTDQL